MPIFAKFDQHASHYDKATPIQTDVALFLAQKILNQDTMPTESLPTQSSWADIGCGTGKLSEAVITQLLASGKQLPFATLYGVDSSQAMLSVWQQTCQSTGENGLNFHAVCADMQQLPFVDKTLDGLISSFALHWTTPAVMAELGRVVKKGGNLYLAIPVKGSFSQVSERFSALPVFPFLPSSDWQQAMSELVGQRQGDVQFCLERSFSYLYPNLKTLLNELKTMGGAVSGKSPMQPGLLRRYLSDMSAIALDYQMLMIGLTLN